ncbi:hypothetical protein ACLOJK_000389 [Asimina triloba]
MLTAGPPQLVNPTLRFEVSSARDERMPEFEPGVRLAHAITPCDGVKAVARTKELAGRSVHIGRTMKVPFRGLGTTSQPPNKQPSLVSQP